MAQVRHNINNYCFDLFSKAILKKSLLCNEFIVEATLMACSSAYVSADFHVDFTNIKKQIGFNYNFYQNEKKTIEGFLEIQSEETSEFLDVPFLCDTIIAITDNAY